MTTGTPTERSQSFVLTMLTTIVERVAQKAKGDIGMNDYEKQLEEQLGEQKIIIVYDDMTIVYDDRIKNCKDKARAIVRINFKDENKSLIRHYGSKERAESYVLRLMNSHQDIPEEMKILHKDKMIFHWSKQS